MADSMVELHVPVTHERHAVAKFDLLKHGGKTLSPRIFAHARPAPSHGTESRQLRVLENLLGVVVQAYYKSNYALETVYPELGLDPTANNALRAQRPKNSRTRAPNAQKSTEPRAKAESGQQHAEQTPGTTVDGRHLMDYLVSPLKVDAEFGAVIRNLVN